MVEFRGAADDPKGTLELQELKRFSANVSRVRIGMQA